jgi:hypothetical protein
LFRQTDDDLRFKIMRNENRLPKEDGVYMPKKNSFVRNVWHPNGEFNSISDAAKNESNGKNDYP